MIKKMKSKTKIANLMFYSIRFCNFQINQKEQYLDHLIKKSRNDVKFEILHDVAECFKDRTDVQCLHRWQKVLNPELVKGPWSKEVRRC